MDNSDDDFVNYNLKRKKSKKNKDAKKYSKTCAIYGIFDCTCCKKEDNNRVYDSIIDETINQPSTSRVSSNEDHTESKSNDDFLDDIIDVGTYRLPNPYQELDTSINRSETNERQISQDVIEYINNVYEEYGNENETTSEATEIENEILSEQILEISDPAPTTTHEPLTTNDETIASPSIKSEVLPVTEEEEEEIDVVNIPADDIQNNLIENNLIQTVQQPENEIKPEISDDENQIIDILNFDETDRREDLVNNLETNTTNMESSSNTNEEEEIIDVENAVEETSSQDQEQDSLAERILRRHRLKRRLTSHLRLDVRKRPRLLRSLMTIDLINTSREDSIIEITDSPVAQMKVTEVINVDDDDENDEDLDKSLCSTPHRIGLGNCPVCLENLAKKEIMSTICGHVYCARCIKNVIKTTKKCPNCRKHLTLKSIHPLFI